MSLDRTLRRIAIAACTISALAALSALSACDATSTAIAPNTSSDAESARVIARLVVTGSPESATGATWTYRDSVAGVVYDLAGVLIKPTGPGPFPAIIVSHGYSGSASGYSRNVGATMARWGAVVIATNYTHALGVAPGSPGTAFELGASIVNVQRARRLVELLRALGYVDMSRIAAHGHSMGAFVTTALAATHPDLLRVASHTAGGVRPDASTGSLPSEAQGRAIRTPYQIHHGDRDAVVVLSADQRLDAAMNSTGVAHELVVYPGSDHDDVAFNPIVMERVRAWYIKHGLF